MRTSQGVRSFFCPIVINQEKFMDKSARKDSSPAAPIKRESGIELLRILCMLMIIAHHYAFHGGYDFDWSELNLKMYTVQCLNLYGRLACSVFALISGYFLIRSDERAASLKEYYRRIFPLTLEMVLYTWAILACAWWFNLIPLKETVVIKTLFPIIWGNWYVIYYALFFLVTPFVNRLLRSLDRKTFFNCLLGVFFVWSFVPTFSSLAIHEVGHKTWYSGWVFSAFAFFAVMYGTGAFIRLHGSAYKRWSRFQVPVLIASVLFLPLSVAAFDAIGVKLHDNNYIWGAGFFAEYTRIPAVACSICLFLIFKKFHFHSRTINFIAASTLGVYILHENPIMNQWIWRVVAQLQKMVDPIPPAVRERCNFSARP